VIKQTLYFGNPTYLRIKDKQLVIELINRDRKNIITRPIEDIGLIILDNPQITISQQAILSLQMNKALIVCCDEKHMPLGIMYPLVGHSEQTQRQHIQLKASRPLIKNLWQQTVEAKIANQILVLQQIGKSSLRLEHIVKQINSGDPENKEGQAAAYYWKEYIDDFIRDRYGEEPNGLLNYGYAILRSMMARALISSGLNLTIGIFHHNKYNPYCLVDDIMEPFRPFVDLLVYKLFVRENLDSFLDNKVKKELLALGQLDGLFGKLRRPLMVGMSLTSSSLVDCFSKKKRKINFPKLII